MYHRYGRHGPHAWKRWRERRFQRRLPAVVPTVAVVRVQNPISTERIIIIIMQQRPEEFDEHGEENQDTPPLPFPDSRLIGSSRDERTIIYQRLENRAKLDAHRKASADISKYLNTGEDLPSLQLIELEAIDKALEHINYSDIQKGDLDIDLLRDHSVHTYMKIYQEDIERAVGKGILFSEEEKKIRRQAREERAFHERARGGNTLSDIELTCHAAIRAQEYLGLDTQSDGYLTHIITYAQIYKHAYREEKDRQPRSNPFPSSGWQQSGGRYSST